MKNTIERIEENAPIYIDERWPESNEKDGVHYVIEYVTGSDSSIHANLAYTAEEMRGYVLQIKNNGYRIVNAYRHENDKRREFIPETAKEKTERKNREHCKRIAEELEAYAEGTVYRCPECGEIIEWDNEQYNDEEAEYTCQCCGETFDESDLEALSVYDFIADVYDIEYRIGSDMEYRSVKIMVACGGPNIYIDTARRMVQLYWWTDYAEYPISSDAAEELDSIMEELYQCH